MSSSDVGGKSRVAEQLVQALVSADETRLADRGGLVASHASSSWAVSRFHENALLLGGCRVGNYAHSSKATTVTLSDSEESEVGDEL